MKGFQWKRLVMVLSLLLIVATVSSLAIGFYTANAAITSNLTITFGEGGNWTTYYKAANQDDTTTTTNTTNVAQKRGGLEGTETVNSTKFDITNNASTDLNIWLDFTASGGITLQANDIIYVRYTCIAKT